MPPNQKVNQTPFRYDGFEMLRILAAGQSANISIVGNFYPGLDECATKMLLPGSWEIKKIIRQ